MNLGAANEICEQVDALHKRLADLKSSAYQARRAGPVVHGGSAVMVRASWVRDVTPVFRNTFRR